MSTPNSAVPNDEMVKSKLTNAQAVPFGIKEGLIFGTLGAVPLWGIERLSKCEPLIKELLGITELSMGRRNLEWTRQLTDKMKNPAYQLLASTAGTVGVAALTGGTLGWWSVKHIKSKLLDINKMKQEQQAGTFQPKLSIAQRLGLAKKPSNNPDQEYQDLLQNNLNSAHAFKQGAIDVALVKLAPALVPIGLVAGYLGYAKLSGDKKSVNFIMDNLEFAKILKAMVHPVFIAKCAALPLIGGLIAKETVPWVKSQLGIESN